MKKFLAAVMVVVLLPATVFAAYTPGSYTAKMDTNIRSLPSMSGLLIGHFNRGDAVNVLRVVGSWCRVASKYSNSYVYCRLLASAAVSGSVSVSVVPVMDPFAFTNATATTSNGVVTDSLKGLQYWLLTNSEGADYINNSYFKVRDGALTWDGESNISDFYFQWPLLTGTKCNMTFTGSYHSSEVFHGDCFDASGNVATSKVAVDVPPQSYALPVLLFKSFVSNLLVDNASMATLNNYFSKSQHITALYRLYRDAQGVQRWEGKFIDDINGSFMVVTADASKTNGPFTVQKGLFQ